MVQRTQIILVDDVDGGDADESVTFAIDGVSYEIDLSEPNASALRDALAPWVGHARRIGGRVVTNRVRPGRPRAAGGAKTDLSEVRSWAREHGFTVSDRGRVSSEVMSAYEAAE